MEAERSASNQVMSGVYPRYDEAVCGFRNYWFPVAFSRQVGAKPRAKKILTERLVLLRDNGKVYALHDRCPHRGIPLSAGHQVTSGTLTCPYHGWTYDLNDGELVATLSDAPDSAICGKVRVQTYPVEERLGLVWVYVGDGNPPPVEKDIPAELFEPHTILLGVARVLAGNWRYAMENAMDEAHPRTLHRNALWTFHRQLPAWTTFDIGLSQEDAGPPWLVRWATKIVGEDTYPRVGRWPPRKFVWLRAQRKVRVSGRLPGVMRIEGESRATVYHWCVPVDENHYLRISTLVKRASGLYAVGYRLWYWVWARWVRLGQFIGQDQWMIELMQIPPERLFGPDKAITAWRKYCQEHARDAAGSPSAHAAEPALPLKPAAPLA